MVAQVASAQEDNRVDVAKRLLVAVEGGIQNVDRVPGVSDATIAALKKYPSIRKVSASIAEMGPAEQWKISLLGVIRKKPPYDVHVFKFSSDSSKVDYLLRLTFDVEESLYAGFFIN